MPSWFVSSWSKIRRAWSLAGGVAVAPADAAGLVVVADDDVDGVVALDDGVALVAALGDVVAADGAAEVADDDEEVVDVSACANCMSRDDDARVALSTVAQAVPATPMAAAASTVASRILKRAFMSNSSVDRMAARKRRMTPDRCKDPAVVMR
jgi:hypothetical protein